MDMHILHSLPTAHRNLLSHNHQTHQYLPRPRPLHRFQSPTLFSVPVSVPPVPPQSTHQQSPQAHPHNHQRHPQTPLLPSTLHHPLPHPPPPLQQEVHSNHNHIQVPV